MTVREALVVASGHPAFAGHFPTQPILPGAVLLDEVLAALARAHSLDLRAWQLSAAKFLGVITPGEALVLEHDVQPSGAIRFAVRAGERGMQRAVASGMLSSSTALGAGAHAG